MSPRPTYLIQEEVVAGIHVSIEKNTGERAQTFDLELYLHAYLACADFAQRTLRPVLVRLQ